MPRPAHGQDDEEDEEEVVVEPVLEKLLAFVEAHYDDVAGVDGLNNPYGLQVSPDGCHVYVASMNDDAIAYFLRNQQTGGLTYIGRIKDGENGTDGLNGARALTISPDGLFVYAVSMFDHALVTFGRDATTGGLSYLGKVTDGEGGVDGLNGARSIALSPDGKNLYVAGWGDDALCLFSRNVTTGAASFLGRLKNGQDGVNGLSQPHFVSVSPDGKSVYVALWGEDAISHFSRAADTGLLTYQSKLVDGINGVDGLRGPRAIGVSPDGKQVYVASWNDDAITVFQRNIESGVLEYKSVSKNGSGSIRGIDGPHALVISADGRYLYVASFFSDAVATFARDLETGALTYRQSLFNSDEGIEGLNGVLAVVTSPDGEFVYTLATSDKSLVAFKRTFIVEPPTFVVEPVSRSIEQDESVAFYALAVGVGVEYQWYRNDTAITGETLPVLTIEGVPASFDASVIRVVASNPGGSVDSSSATLTVLPPIVLDGPEDLTALEISSSSARISWLDRSDNETGFEIQRRSVNGSFAAIATVFENQTEYQDTSLSASTTYLYRVRARRNDVTSLWSNDAVVESFANSPNAPADLNVAESTYNKVKLVWHDRSAVEDGFQIQRRLDTEESTWETIANGQKNATQYTDRNVLSDRAYAYRVRAYNASGSSDYSASVVAITDSIPAQSITPTERNVPSAAGTGYGVTVIAQGAWEAVSDVSWIVVTSPTGGQGTNNQGVSYRVATSESLNARVGHISIGGIVHTVTQAASAPFIRILPSRSVAQASGGLVSITIESNIAWSVSESASWVAINSGASGTGYGVIVAQVTANETVTPRIATLMINDREHEIEQSGINLYTNASSETISFTAVGGDGIVSILSNTTWSGTAEADWIELGPEASSQGDGAFTFAVTENPSSESRVADIVVNGQAISITQDAAASYVTASSETLAFGDAGGDGLVSVLSNTTWSATTEADWIALAPEASGQGDNSFTFTVAANSIPESRTAEIAIGLQTFTIVQDAWVKPVSDISPPQFVGTDISSGLGVELTWTDNSDTELGFILRRAELTADAFADIATLDADATRYFDRDAKRGLAYRYEIVAFDVIGCSEPDEIETAVLPSGYITEIVTRVAMAPTGELSYVGFALEGVGLADRWSQNFGPNLGLVNMPDALRRARLQVDAADSGGYVSALAEERDLTLAYDLRSLAFPGDPNSNFSSQRDAQMHCLAADDQDPVHLIGSTSRGYADANGAAMVSCFEIEGEIALPILIRGRGASAGYSTSLSAPVVELYRFNGDGSLTLLGSNGNWESGSAESKSALRAAVARTRTLELVTGSGDAALLRTLSSGRYGVVMRTGANGAGNGALEVFDTR